MKLLPKPSRTWFLERSSRTAAFASHRLNRTFQKRPGSPISGSADGAGAMAGVGGWQPFGAQPRNGKFVPIAEIETETPTDAPDPQRWIGPKIVNSRTPRMRKSIQSRLRLCCFGRGRSGARESPARRPGGALSCPAQSPLGLRPRDQMRVKPSPSSSSKRFA